MRAKYKGISLMPLFALGMGMIFASAGYAAEKPRIAGTYTNMRYNDEGGDLLGEELRIVRTAKGYQATLQFAEGEPSELILVEIKLDGSRVNFSIPEGTRYSGRFSGSITGAILRGKFMFKNGESEAVILKKGKSYWD